MKLKFSLTTIGLPAKQNLSGGGQHTLEVHSKCVMPVRSVAPVTSTLERILNGVNDFQRCPSLNIDVDLFRRQEGWSAAAGELIIPALPPFEI